MYRQRIMQFQVLVDPVALVSNLLTLAKATDEMKTAFHEAQVNPNSKEGFFIVDSLGRGALYFKIIEGWDAPKLHFALTHPTYSRSSLLKRLLRACPNEEKLLISSNFSLELNAHLKTLHLKNCYDEHDNHYFMYQGESDAKRTGSFTLVQLE